MLGISAERTESSQKLALRLFLKASKEKIRSSIE